MVVGCVAPEPHHTPPRRVQRSIMRSIAFHVPRNLLHPVGCVVASLELRETRLEIAAVPEVAARYRSARHRWPRSGASSARRCPDGHDTHRRDDRTRAGPRPRSLPASWVRRAPGQTRGAGAARGGDRPLRILTRDPRDLPRARDATVRPCRAPSRRRARASSRFSPAPTAPSAAASSPDTGPRAARGAAVARGTGS